MALGRGLGPAGKRKRDKLDEEGDTSFKQEGAIADGLFLDEEDSGSDDSEDSEAEGENENDEGITGECEYDESTEAYPQLLVYDAEFARIGKGLTIIPEQVKAVIDESRCQSRRAKSCGQNAQELTSIPPTDPEKIALVGNTGAGKSSLLNSLLGMPKLAKAMAAGQSCTHVSTEYERPFKNQNTKFAAKVQYFAAEEITLLLERFVEDYHTWNFNLPEDPDLEEEQELKRLEATAFEALRSLFCDHPEMKSPTTGREFLQHAYKDPEQDTLEIFKGWCAHILADKEIDEDHPTEYLQADEQSELLEHLNHLVFSSTRLEEPALWPIVKKVTMGVDGPRILDHCIIVDLPGIDDTNRVRANACQQILDDCNSIWVVTKIDRAASDVNVDNLLWRYGKTYKMTVVCTGIDDNIDPPLAAFLYAEGQSIGDHNPLHARESELRRTAKRYRKKIETRRAKLEGRSFGRNGKKQRPLTEHGRQKAHAEITQFEPQLHTTEQELTQVSLSLFETLVDARNAFTIRRLREEKAQHMGKDRDLKIFCVSNIHYDSLKGGRVLTGPRLSANLTGIPTLRQYIFRAAAPKQLKTLENYISHKYTVFMQGLAMWANTYSIDGSKELLEAVEKPQAQIDRILRQYHEGVLRESEERMTTPLLGDLKELIKKASDGLKKKEKWSWATMRAFIRRDGNHQTSVAPKQSFNEQFMEGATALAKKQWDTFTKEHGKLSNRLETELKGLVQGIKKLIERHPAKVVLPIDRLTELFEASESGIEQACEEHREALDKDFRNIFLDLTQDRCTGYFTQTMLEVYEKCKGDRGNGVKLRTIEIFATHLTQEGKKSPFAIMCKKFSQAISKDTKAKNKALARKTEDILKEIHSQLGEIVEQKTEDNAEEWLRVKFREFLGTAAPKFEEIKEDLEKLKRKYRIETVGR